MTGPLIKQLKGRDVRTLKTFAQNLRSTLGEALIDLQLVRVRQLDLDPALALAERGVEGGTEGDRDLPPPPPPPLREMLVVVHTERRDVTIDAELDRVTLEAALEHGGVIAPVLITRRERRELIEQGGAFGKLLEAGEVFE